MAARSWARPKQSASARAERAKDLAAKVIRTPAAPEQSFGDDPLRMLRAARFAAKLQFTVDNPVISAMRDMAPDLDRITAERVRDEFTKLMCAADPITGLRLLVDTGLADRFLPEISGLKLEIDEHAQHKDVYEHTLIVVQNAMRLEGDEGIAQSPLVGHRRQSP